MRTLYTNSIQTKYIRMNKKTPREIYAEWGQVLKETKAELDEIQREAEQLLAKQEQQEQQAKAKDLARSLRENN